MRGGGGSRGGGPNDGSAASGAGGRRRGSRLRFRSPSRRGSRRPIAVARGWLRLGRAGGSALEVLRFDVRDVEEAVAADRKIDERGLNRRLEVDDSSFINVTGVALVAGTLDVKLFENTVFDDGDPAFLGLFHVDQHFFLHAISFRDLRLKTALLCGVRVVGQTLRQAQPE